MKKLQCNFTTPEQSKRLLELGVPADSADCFWFDERDLMFLKDELYSDEAKDGEWVRATDYLPCWSVGRLIEIYLICNEVIDNVTELHHSAIKIDVREFNTVEYLISKLTNKVKKNKEFFSKLEE